MKKPTILLAVLSILTLSALPHIVGCNDCDRDGFPESLVPCENGTMAPSNQTISAKTADTNTPVDYDTDGEPSIDADIADAANPAE